MNPYLIFTNIFNKTLNPYILSNCSNIFYQKYNSQVMNKLKVEHNNDNNKNEDSNSHIQLLSQKIILMKKEIREV